MPPRHRPSSSNTANADGSFRFRVAFGGRETLVSRAYANGKEAGAAIAAVQAERRMQVRCRTRTGASGGRARAAGRSCIAVTRAYASAAEAVGDAERLRQALLAVREAKAANEARKAAQKA
jgi:hypothetical protein